MYVRQCTYRPYVDILCITNKFNCTYTYPDLSKLLHSYVFVVAYLEIGVILQTQTIPFYIQNDFRSKNTRNVIHHIQTLICIQNGMFAYLNLQVRLNVTQCDFRKKDMSVYSIMACFVI